MVAYGFQALGRFLPIILIFFMGLGSVSSTRFRAIAFEQLRVIETAPRPFIAPPTQERTLLKIREPIKRRVTSGETQVFALELAADQFAEVVFEWQGINLSVALFNPTGVKMIPADIRVSSPGPVSVFILAENAGAYKLEVTTPVTQKISGKYEVKLEATRLPSAADRNRLVAQNQIAEGQESSTAATRIQKYNQAANLFHEAGDVNSEARVHMLLGDAHRAARELQDAKASYERAAAIWKAYNHPKGEGYAKVSLGILYRSFNMAKDALLYFEQAQLLFDHIGDRRGQADALYGQAFALMMLGQTPQAIDVLQQTVHIRRGDDDRMGEGSALNMMADAYRLLGDLDKSLEIYDEATKAISGLEHRSLEANLINGRAVVYDDQGYWQKAKDEYGNVLTAYQTILGQPLQSACNSKPSLQDAPYCRAVASVLVNLGEAYNSLGQPVKALREFGKSLTISDALGQPLEQGSARFHLGYAEFLLGNIDRAMDYYNKALTFQEYDDKGKALTYTYMGMAYSASNEPIRALEQYQKALRLLLDLDDKRALAITLDKLANGYSRVGNASEASTNYAKAIDLWRAIKDPDGEALTLHNIAIAEHAAGNLTAASQNAQASIRLVESLRTRLSNERLRASYLAAKENYYEIDIDLKMQLAKSNNQVVHIAAALESNEKAKARGLLDALSRSDLARSEFNQPSDPKLGVLGGERLNIQSKLAAFIQARTRLLSGQHTPVQITAIDNEIDKINEDYDEVTAKMRLQSPRFAALTEPQPSTIKETQQQLDSDTLLLEYSLGDKRSYVWAVTPDSIKGLELRGREEIESTALRITKALTERNRETKNETPSQWRRRIDRADAEYAEASAALSKMVIEPVAAEIGNKRLVIVADGALQLVSFGALPGSKRAGAAEPVAPKAKAPRSNSVTNNRRSLLEDHEIVYEPSASVLALQRRELENRKPALHAVAVLADPVFDDDGVKREINIRSANRAGAKQQQRQTDTSRPPSAKANVRSDLTRALDDIGLNRFSWLPFSRREADAIIRVAPRGESKAALGFDASRATAMSPELSKYRIVHFATHGVVDFEHPELSGIVLSMVNEKGEPQDGYLRLHEIYNLNLPADLVVLSACQTGIGKQIKGEGLIALTRGFMYAGAQRVVASLWKVDDAATAELMAEFYKQMLTNGLKPAAALRQAQLKLSQIKRWRSPYYWAGFVLQGEWK